jgi:hypothetical protein
VRADQAGRGGCVTRGAPCLEVHAVRQVWVGPVVSLGNVYVRGGVLRIRCITEMRCGGGGSGAPTGRHYTWDRSSRGGGVVVVAWWSPRLTWRIGCEQVLFHAGDIEGWHTRCHPRFVLWRLVLPSSARPQGNIMRSGHTYNVSLQLIPVLATRVATGEHSSMCTVDTTPSV